MSNEVIDESSFDESAITATREYAIARLQLALKAVADDAPIFSQIDMVLCEDGRTIMLYGHRRDGRLFTQTFERPDEVSQ